MCGLFLFLCFWGGDRGKLNTEGDWEGFRN